jgi:hypothetical protein
MSYKSTSINASCEENGLSLFSFLTKDVFSAVTSIVNKKYVAKVKLIDEAQDINTQEKLDAYDKALDRYILDIALCLYLAGSAYLLFTGRIRVSTEPLPKIRKLISG